MTKQVIDIGTVGGDGTGDPLRTAYGKANDNFTEVYALACDKIVAVGDETTAITTGTAKVTFYMERAGAWNDCFTGLTTQSSSGVVTVNVKKNGTTIFSTKPSIDANEDTSLTGTAAVLTTAPTTYAKGDKITIDIDAAGTGAKGLKCYLLG